MSIAEMCHHGILRGYPCELCDRERERLDRITASIPRVTASERLSESAAIVQLRADLRDCRARLAALRGPGTTLAGEARAAARMASNREAIFAAVKAWHEAWDSARDWLAAHPEGGQDG